MVSPVFLASFSIDSSKYTPKCIKLCWSSGQDSRLHIRRLQVRILPSAKIILLLKKNLYFLPFFQNLTFNTKNRHSSNTFWSLQHGVKKLYFLSYSHLKQQLLIWVTLQKVPHRALINDFDDVSFIGYIHRKFEYLSACTK